MNKFLSFSFFIALSLLAFGYEQFTQIGEAAIDVRKQALQQNIFRRDEKLVGARRVQACESIDNSMMVVFCDMIPASTFEEWFGDAGIRNSLQALLRRGGVIYIGWNSWSTFNSELKNMRRFFADNGIAMTPAASLADFPHPKIKDYEEYAYAANECDAEFLRKPFDFTDESRHGELRVMANRWYKDWNAQGVEDAFVTKDGRAVIRVQRNILGKGTVVSSMGFTVLRQPEAPLVINLVNYAYGERKPLSDKELAQAEISRLMNGNTTEKYLVWKADPFARMYSTSLPKTPEDSTELSVTVARNEKECLAFCVTNVSDNALTFRLEPEPETHGYFGDSEVYYTELLTIKEVLPRMNQLGEAQLDAICERNQGGVITVPAYETRMCWIDVKTTLPAGKYDFTLELVPTATRDARKRVHVAVNVLDYAFPDELRPQIFGFGPYGMTFAEGTRRTRNHIDFFGRNHLNHIIIGSGCPTQAIKKDDATGKIVISDNLDDFATEDEDYCFENGYKWFHSYGCYLPFIDTLKGLGMKDASIYMPEAKALFSEFLRRWADSYRAKKIPFDRFYVGICDEVAPDFYEEYIEVGKCLKENAPEFRIFGTIATWVEGIDLLERFDEFMDLWIPWEPRLTERPTAAKELALYQRPENSFMPYLCSVGLHIQPMQTYFRFRGMRTFLMKSDKFSLWGFNSWRGNPWFSSATPADNSFMFYNGDQAPVPTPRLEAFREGIEDMHMLLEAQELLKKAANPALENLISEKCLNDVMKADDPEKTAAWRTSLLEALDSAE